MIFDVDGTPVYEILNWQQTLIQNDIPTEIFTNDMNRRARYSVEAPIHKLIHVNKAKFNSLLQSVGVVSIPANLTDYAILLGSRNDLGLQKPSQNRRRGLRSDNSLIFTILPEFLTLSMTYLNLGEEEYIPHQVNWVFGEKIKGCLRRMHLEWDPKLAERSLDIPLQDEAFVNLVTSQPDYHNRSARLSDQERIALGIGV